MRSSNHGFMVLMRKALMVLAGLAPLGLMAYYPVPPPAWSESPEAARHLFLFPDANVNPTADVNENALEFATAQVRLGPFSAGWQDPDPTKEVPDSYGLPGHGAWDLGQGPTGSIQVTIPVLSAAQLASGTPYRVELQINVVGYDILPTLPTLSAESVWLDMASQTDSLAFFDIKLGYWMNRTWLFSMHNVRSEAIDLFILADPVWGSTLDAIEIHALAVPVFEPEYTALGTPFAWYRSFSVLPTNESDWDAWNALDYLDSDDDGMLNWQEYVAGTRPDDPDSVLKIVTLSAEMDALPYLEWIGGTTGPSAPYIIESTLSLTEPEWKPVGTRTRQDGLNDWLGTEPLAEPRRFYRIIAPRDSW